MCGIAGLVAPAGGGRRRRSPAAHDADPRASGTRRRGLPPRWRDRARPPPAVDHRPRRRQPAHGLGRRAGVDHLQRRDLQLSGAARPARGPRLSVPDGVRHRGRPGRLRDLGRGLRAPPPGHVRLRPVGRQAPPPAARAGPRRHQAAGLRVGRVAAPLRLRAEGDPPGSVGAARPRLERPPRVPHLPLRAEPAHHLPGRAQAGACLLPRAGRRAPDRRRPSLLGSPLRPRRAAVRRRLAGRAQERAHRRRAEPPGERRAARRFPERGHGLERGGGLDGPGRPSARPAPSPSASRKRASTSWTTRGAWPSTAAPITTSSWSSPTRSRSCRSSHGSSTNPSPTRRRCRRTTWPRSPAST